MQIEILENLKNIKIFLLDQVLILRHLGRLSIIILRYTDRCKGYKKVVAKGDIHALMGFNVCEKVAADVEKNIVGITTSEGVKISSFTTHFMDQVIGQTEALRENKRQGTPMVDVKDALENPVKLGQIIAMNDGDIRQMYLGKRASVVISITDKRVIQVTPRKEK